MKCREARRLVYLYREGEMPEEVRRQVFQHAGSCLRCAMELRQAGNTGLFIADLRNSEPRLHAQRDLTDQIMRAVQSVGMDLARLRPRRVILPFRGLQIACTLAAAAIVVAFFLQTATDVYRMAALEARLDQSPVALMARTEESPYATLGLNTIAEVGKILSQSQVPPTDAAGLQGRLRLRGAVRSFFDVLEGGPPGFVAEVQRLRARYPELWFISPLDGLTSRDRFVLSRQGKGLMTDLRKLLQPGKSIDDK